MSKVLLVPFFPGHGLQKTAFFNDVTITSSLRSVVQVLIRHFTIFQSDRLQMICAKIVKSCLNLSKFRPKYYRPLFFWDTVYKQDHMLREDTMSSKF